MYKVIYRTDVYNMYIYEKQVTFFYFFLHLFMTRTRKRKFNFSPGSVQNLTFGAHFFLISATKEPNTVYVILF
jgi:hypothetical protein